MTIGVNNTPVKTPVRAVANTAANKPAAAPAADTKPTANAPTKAADAPTTEAGNWLEKMGVAGAFEKALNAGSSDEVVAAISGGLAQLAVERTAIGDFDKKLHDDFRGTITKNVSNETAQKALLAMADIFGDKVASEMVAAGVGAVTGTAVELIKDEKFRGLYKSDPKAFGLEVAKRGGKNFAVALGGAFATAKAEELLPAGLKWLAHISFIQKLLGIKG
ncbi:MAG: hypothetical protein JWM80_4013 [Cyanobacteria bacterium RYN_339]|nr:hypothetical protein [Cyanobacteria bacterium RYN_339]